VKNLREKTITAVAVACVALALFSMQTSEKANAMGNVYVDHTLITPVYGQDQVQKELHERLGL
jgi:hypothetical protein